MPDKTNSTNRQQVFRPERGKVDAQRQKSEKIENEVKEEESREAPISKRS